MSQIGRNIWFASLSMLIPSILTYIFWFLTAKMVGPSAIGLASTIGSITVIFATLDVLDLSIGMKRSLGIAYAAHDLTQFKQILISAVFLVSLLVSLTAVILAAPQLHILERLGIEPIYTWIIIAMIPALSFQYIFTEAIISALRSKHLLLPLIVGSLLRFPVFVTILYVFDRPVEASIFAYSMLIFVPTIFYAFFLKNFLSVKVPFNTSKIISQIKTILPASLASWFPHLMSVLGSQLGVVTVFSVSGSTEGGLFYIPMAIFSVVLFLIGGMNRVSHPLVAGLASENDQIKLLTNLMKVAFMFTMPLVALVSFYPANILSLLGNEFRPAAPILSTMMLAIPFAIICELVYYFVYGRGDNKSVLFLGLAANIPRIILYLILTPELGGIGAALAYVTGSLSQFALTIRIGKSHSLSINFSKCIVISLIPLALGSFTWILGLDYVISILVIILTSLVLYIRFHILEEVDITNIIYSCLPAPLAKRVHPLLILMIRKLS